MFHRISQCEPENALWAFLRLSSRDGITI